MSTTRVIRLPVALLDRVRALAPRMVRVGPPLSEAEALRIVVDAGIEAIDANLSKEKT